MHQYLRSIGFCRLQKQPQVWNLLTKIQKQPDYSKSVTVDEESSREMMFKEFAPDMGIAVNGLRYRGRFHREFYYPYLKSRKITSLSPCTVSKLGEKEAYAGVCDDPHLGCSLIFYLVNALEVLEKNVELDVPLKNKGICLTGLASSGKILLPIHKTISERVACQLHSEMHAMMVEDAREGNEDAIGALTQEEVDLFNEITHRMMTDDLYAMIDTFIMPTGVECDQYTLMGEITDLRKETNAITGESICVMGILVNNINFTVAINETNLLGKPQIGRRFKGEVWLQGSLQLEK